MTIPDATVRQQLRGTEIAGGDGYTPALHPADADREVSTLAQLKSALASSAETIAIADTAQINVSNEHMGLNLRDKRLVSYRGWGGRTGGLLFSTRQGYVGSRPFTPLYSEGSPEIHGLRIRGANHNQQTFMAARNAAGNTVYNNTLARAIMLRGPGGRVCNCEIWGWTWNGVHLKGRVGNNRLTRAEVDHCHMYRSKQIGYGYGVDIWYGVGNIHHNYFDDQRHSIDGFGYPESGFNVEHNVFGPTHYIHPVDMHCLSENRASSNKSRSNRNFGLRAGGRMTIRHNQFVANRTNRNGAFNAIAIRGEPLDGVWIERNRFAHPARPPRNTGNSQGGHAWRQVNVNLSGWPDLRDTPEGFTRNFHDANNEFGLQSLDLGRYRAGGRRGRANRGVFPRERGQAVCETLPETATIEAMI